MVAWFFLSIFLIFSAISWLLERSIRVDLLPYHKYSSVPASRRNTWPRSSELHDVSTFTSGNERVSPPSRHVGVCFYQAGMWACAYTKHACGRVLTPSMHVGVCIHQARMWACAYTKQACGRVLIPSMWACGRMLTPSRHVGVCLHQAGMLTGSRNGFLPP